MKNLIYIFSTVIFILLSSQIMAADNVMQTTEGVIEDSAITTSIKAQYAADPLVNPFKVNVSTNNGFVTLSGQVDADTQFERAMIIAESTDGVKDVNGRDLKIKSSEQPFTDTYITAKAKGVLLKNEFVNGHDFSVWEIHVETKNGVVFLTGKVKNTNEKTQVVKIISAISGVKSVKEDLKVG